MAADNRKTVAFISYNPSHSQGIAVIVKKPSGIILYLCILIPQSEYRKIVKISFGAYVFKGIVLGGAYIWTEICVSKLARLILGG